MSVNRRHNVRRWAGLSADGLTIVLAIVAMLVGVRALLSNDAPRRAPPSLHEAEALAIGRTLDSLVVTGASDPTPRVMRFRGERQLLLVFRADCAACRAVKPLYRAPATAVAGRPFTVTVTTQGVYMTNTLRREVVAHLR